MKGDWFNYLPEPGTLQQEYPFALIDAHVHIYDCFSIGTFLDAATRNFHVAAQAASIRNPCIGVLFLTETARDNAFDALLHAVTERKETVHCPPWKFTRTEEECSLLAVNQNNQVLVIVAGRQIISQEKLEILALGTTKSFPEGLPIEDTLALVRASQALAVLPWGFGKWLSGRGLIIEALLQSTHHPELFLGDNSGRPHFLSRPGLFKQAEKRDIRILPGSDPLPFPREVAKPGSYGFILNHKISTITPASEIKRLLAEPEFAVKPYGEAETLFRFVRNQIAMQLAKYKG